MQQGHTERGVYCGSLVRILNVELISDIPHSFLRCIPEWGMGRLLPFVSEGEL